MSDKERLEDLESKINAFEQKYSQIKPKKISEERGGASFIAAELVAGVIVGSLIGYNLDQYLHTKILFLLIFIILGLISSLYNIYNKFK